MPETCCTDHWRSIKLLLLHLVAFYSPLTVYQSCMEKILAMTGTKEMCLCGGHINITLKIGSMLVDDCELG